MEVAAPVVLQLPEELLRILGLLIVLLLLGLDIVELVGAHRASLLRSIVLRARLAVGVTAHEDDDGQVQVLLAVITLFRVEILGLRFELRDVFAQALDSLHILLKLVIVLANLRALRLQPFQQIVSDDAELELRLALENL